MRTLQVQGLANPAELLEQFKTLGFRFVAETCPMKLEAPYTITRDPDTGITIFWQGMTWTEWCERVQRHDFTYAKSDDPTVYHHANFEDRLLRRMAKEFPIEDVRRVWNTAVDATVLYPHSLEFHWR